MQVNDLVSDNAMSSKDPKPYANITDLAMGAWLTRWWVGESGAELEHLESALVN